MWWQILPGGLICCGCLYAPQIFVYISNNLFLGTPYMRNINKYFEAHMFLRDYRLTGNVYKQNGLNCLTPVYEPEYIEECIPTRRLKTPEPKPGESDL